MSYRNFTEDEKEKNAYIFILGLRTHKKVVLSTKREESSFAELENYFFNLMTGKDIPCLLADIIPFLHMNEQEATEFASYLAFCISDRYKKNRVAKAA